MSIDQATISQDEIKRRGYAEREALVMRSLMREDERAKHVLEPDDQRRLLKIAKRGAGNKHHVAHLIELIKSQQDGIDVSRDMRLRAWRHTFYLPGTEINFLLGVIRAYEYWLDKPMKDELAERERLRKEVID